MHVRAIVRLVLTLAIVPAAVGTATAQALGWPQSEAAFSADRIMQSAGMQMSGRLYHDHGKERWEVSNGGMQQVMIMRPDLQKMFMVIPQMNMAMELPLGAGAQFAGPQQYLQGEPQPVGEEEIDGFATTKYRYDGDGETGPYTVFTWITEDGVNLRMEGSSSDGTFTMHLENLTLGPQDPALFELPPGAQVMPSNPALLQQLAPSP